MITSRTPRKIASIFLAIGLAFISANTQAASAPLEEVEVHDANGRSRPVTIPRSSTYGPANDDFGYAQLISGASGSVAGTINDATAEPGEPNHAGALGYHSIWYTWTAPRDGLFIFDRLGSFNGVVLAIYTGSAVSALAPVADSGSFNYNDAGNYNVTGRVCFQATTGTTYRIALDGPQPYFFGPTVLNWRLATAPANDNFGDAQEISGTSGSVSRSNVDASKEPGEPAHAVFAGGASIWYKWTAPLSGEFHFKVDGTFSKSGFPLLGIYTGSTVDHLRGVARDSGTGRARAQISVIAGEIYYIAVDSTSGDTAANLTLSWVQLPAGPRTYEPYAFTTLAGNSPGDMDGAGNGARFSRPNATALDANGNVYIADTANHTIRKITAAGVVTTLAGSPHESGSADGSGAAARFNSPLDIATAPDGFIYVADSGNHIIRKVTPAGVVTTFAGASGFFGALDGSGTNALFDRPCGIAVGSNGSIYVVDTNSSTIRKITPNGTVTTFAGLAGSYDGRDGTGANAHFDYPAGLDIDESGNLYVADRYNDLIRKITPAGVVSTYAGKIGFLGDDDGPSDVATFSMPSDVTVDGMGNVYVLDQGRVVRKITPAGDVSTFAGAIGPFGSDDGIGDAARFYIPSGMAVTAAGTLYVADTLNSIIRKIDPAASVTTLAGSTSPGGNDGTGTAARFSGSEGVAVDRAGNIYVADSENHAIRKITPQGVTTTLAGMPGIAGSENGSGSAARFQTPRGLVVDASGIVYVADTFNHMVRKITPAGVVTTIAGTRASGNADGTGTAARFRLPHGIAVDSLGNLYVSDTNNHTIRKITPSAQVTTLAGTAGAAGSVDGMGSAARFAFPRGLTCDGAGNVFVADTYNCAIRKITTDSSVTTLAGELGVAGNNDGLATTAHFFNLSGIAADLVGNLYVDDRGNSLIRKIASDGTVTTLAGALGQNGNQNGIGSAARFDYASGIAVDSVGRLYVADTFNNTVRIGRRAPLSTLEMTVGANGHRFLTGSVSPSAEVQVMATDSLGASFTLLATVAADENGIYEYEDLAGASLAQRFYRAVVPGSRSALVVTRQSE